MGNSSSSVPQTSHSGVSLSPELEAQIAKDFQAAPPLQAAWKEHKERVLETATIHQLDFQERQAAFDRHYQSFVHQFQTQQDEVKRQVESLRSAFSELSAHVQCDMNRLEDKYLLHDPKRIDGKPSPPPCLAERTALSICYNDNNSTDPISCDKFLNSLEKCAKQVIAGNI